MCINGHKNKVIFKSQNFVGLFVKHPLRPMNNVERFRNIKELGPRMWVALFLQSLMGFKPVLRIRIRSDPVFLGHLEPVKNRSRIPGSLVFKQTPVNLLFSIYVKYCLQYSFGKMIFYL